MTSEDQSRSACDNIIISAEEHIRDKFKALTLLHVAANGLSVEQGLSLQEEIMTAVDHLIMLARSLHNLRSVAQFKTRHPELASFIHFVLGAYTTCLPETAEPVDLEKAHEHIYGDNGCQRCQAVLKIKIEQHQRFAP